MPKRASAADPATDDRGAFFVVAWLALATAIVLLWPLAGTGGNRLTLLADAALSAFVAEGLDGFAVSALVDRLGSLLRVGLVLASAVGFGGAVVGWAAANEDESSPLVERLALAAALGMAAIGLATFLLGVAGLLNFATALLLLLAGIGSLAALHPWTTVRSAWRRRERPPGWIVAVVGFVGVVTFVGATTPSRDFDVREYHLLGPAEWFRAGRIAFLEHNVYTSFPTLAEMHSLLQFHLGAPLDDAGPERWGQIYAKAVAWLFVPITAALLWGFGSRLGRLAGPLAAVVFVTTPWTAVMAQVAYVEGPLCLFTLATFVTAIRADDARGGLLAGLFAGAAAAVKYTGVVYVAVPLGLYLLVCRVRRRAPWSTLLAAIGGGAIVFGPWVLKNAIETGNPVYPLAYSVFGGVDLDDEWAVRWRDAHAAQLPSPTDPIGLIGDFGETVAAVAVATPLQSMLLLPFVPIGIWASRDRRLAWGIAAAAGWVFLVYWAATHRIDRFWLPLLPFVSLLAGRGAASLLKRRTTAARWLAHGAFALGVVLGGLVMLSPATGPPDALRSFAEQFDRAAKPSVRLALDARSAERRVPTPDGDGAPVRFADTPDVLMIGEAEVLGGGGALRYSTVFDRSLFHRLTGTDPGGPADGDEPAAANIVCERLGKAGVGLVVANWAEVLRYRMTYGTTDYDRFAHLQTLRDRGVLKPVEIAVGPDESPSATKPVAADRSDLFGSWDALSPQERAELEAMGLPHLERFGLDVWPRLTVDRVVCDSLPEKSTPE